MRRVIHRLVRARGFALAALPTLALSIAATTAVFSIVEAVLLRPLPYVAADRLVDLSHTLEVSGAAHVDQSDASFLYYRRDNRSFTDVGAYMATAVNLETLEDGTAGGDDRATRVVAARISAGTFGILEVHAMLGRVFRDTEDRPDAAPVVIIGERLWRNAYGSASDIIGQKLDVDGVPRQIVGIMPASFRFPAEETEIWLPIGIDPAKTDSASFDYRGIARLRDGVSVTAAQNDLQRALLRLPDAIPGRLSLAAIQITKMRAVVTPLRDSIVGDIGRVLWLVLGTVVCILLIGCANVATLFLVRAEVRQPELAVRQALGAGRRALVMDVLAEAGILALAGGAAGLALAAAGVKVLQSLDTSIHLPRLSEAGIDTTTFAVAVGVSAAVALLMSLLPAWRVSSLGPALILHDGGRSATAGRGRNRFRRSLVIAQTAVALVLIFAAGLMVRSFAELTRVRPGFDPAEVFTSRVAFPAAAYPSRDDAVRIMEQALNEIRNLPKAEFSGAITKLPLSEEGRIDSGIFVQDRPIPPGGVPTVRQIALVSPGYFQAMSIPFVEGRTFEPMEPGKARPEVVLSEALAEHYWGPSSALGKQIRITPAGTWLTVIGVARGVHNTALEQSPDEMIYLPLEANDPRWSPRNFAVVVRSAGTPDSTALQVAQTLRQLAPAIPLYASQPMTAIVSHAHARTSFLVLLLAVASVIALSLGVVGLSGMSAYAVTIRRREIAIRLALGASPARVQRVMSRQAFMVALAGVALGIAISLVAARTLASLLFGVSPSDPLILAGASALMLIVAALSTWIPTRRASSIDPAEALHSD